MSDSKARREEERFKEAIYESLETASRLAAKEALSETECFAAGRYEDQDAFLAVAPMVRANKNVNEIQRRNRILRGDTYFGHVEVVEDGCSASEHYFLTNSERLDELLSIDDGNSKCAIVPFIQDKDRPFFGALANCYQSHSSEGFEIITLDRRTKLRDRYCYHPQLIREVHVKNRQIVGEVLTFYSASGEDNSTDDYEEFFAIRLEENRSSPGLHNIIATLRKQQFEIINADKALSFVVQGCAGSGKSQCLIHRLFYLRGALQDDGWDKVLLITPTQLFRNYSAELMRRYRLDGVANTSISEFYQMLLSAFDPRFRNRQYAFELSEEYLPDKYLHEVYAPANMMRIDRAIQDAICSHVEVGCELLEIDAPNREDIDIDYVNALASKLSERIRRFDETESQMSDDPEYQEHRQAIDALDKDLKGLHRRQDGLLERKKQLETDYEEFRVLEDALTSAEADLREWTRLVAERKEACRCNLQDCVDQLNVQNLSARMFALLARYVDARTAVIDAIAPWGEQASVDAEYLKLLSKSCEECRQRLMDHTKRSSVQTWVKNHEKSVQTNAANLESIQDDIAITELYLEDHSNWLQNHNVEEARKQRQTYRSELERARYYLSRIESSVFEQEVWNELSASKKENGIDTLQIGETKEGHQRQNRILYKSDLLFYLKIYHILHKKRTLPDYRMICIDEGQDLHSADYALLRLLYPEAVLNIFGDTAQALHVDCGISDWQQETGIDKVFTLNSNYRNNAAIVDFCNKKFGSKMAFCGSAANYATPSVVNQLTFKRTLTQEKAVVIVKNREAFWEMCNDMQIDPSKFNYIDTKVGAVDETNTACYSIYAAKGLEFPQVLVYADGMTLNQKIVACTRAMTNLWYYES